MSPRTRKMCAFVGALMICSTSAALGTPGKAYEQYEDCPWIPRSGRWTIEVGQLSVGGVWTAMGGGGGTVTITVDSCDAPIQIAIGGELGTLAFEPLEGGVRGIPAAVSRRMLRHQREVYRLPAELKSERTFVYVYADDAPIVGMLERLAVLKGYQGALLLEPPESLPLFDEDLYRASVVPSGEQAAMDFVLDYVTQVEMYGFSVFEGWLVPGQEAAAPPFIQFFHWSFDETP